MRPVRVQVSKNKGKEIAREVGQTLKTFGKAIRKNKSLHSLLGHSLARGLPRYEEHDIQEKVLNGILYSNEKVYFHLHTGEVLND